MERFARGWECTRRFVQRFGPYVVIEAVMPGGSLMALALYLYRRRKMA